MREKEEEEEERDSEGERDDVPDKTALAGRWCVAVHDHHHHVDYENAGGVGGGGYSGGSIKATIASSGRLASVIVNSILQTFQCPSSSSSSSSFVCVRLRCESANLQTSAQKQYAKLVEV